MANALSVQAHSVSQPPPQTQDRLAAKQQQHKPVTATAQPAQTSHKVDITV